MPLPGRPRTAGGHEPRFRSRSQFGNQGSSRYRGPAPELVRFHERPQVFVAQLGYTPGVQDVDARADMAAHGTIRRLWRQAVNYIAGPPPFSWTENRVTGGPVQLQAPITRALRYKASSVFRGAGSSNTRFGAPRRHVQSRHNTPRVTQAAGNLQGRPVLRNRLTSFGSRVPPVNAQEPA